MMASTLILALVTFVGICSAAPNHVIQNVDPVIVNYDIDNHAKVVSSSARIVGGSTTTINTYPWIVQMEFFSGVWNQACAGNILNSVYILSAAHCTDSNSDPFYRPENRRIRAGAVNRNTGGVTRTIFSVLNHPDYNSFRSNDADISLIRLTQALTLGTSVQAIQIAPQNYYLPDHVPLVFAGWGATSTGGGVSTALKQVGVNSINLGLCRQRYASVSPRQNVTNNMICAGILNVGGRGACQGDIGGPLYYSTSFSRILVGIISWSINCGDSFFPGVSTRVSSYTNWIVTNAN